MINTNKNKLSYMWLDMQLETILDRKDVPADVKEAIKSYLIGRETQTELGLELRQTFDSMGDAIHVVGPDLRFILFNKAFEQWNKELGLRDDVIGQKIDEVFPFLSDRVVNEYRQVFTTGKPLITEERTTIRNEEFITETRKIPILEDGKATRIVTVIRNITESNQTMMALQESEEKYRNLVERANDGIAIVQDSLIKYVNPCIVQISGYTAEELYNTPIMNYIHPKALPKVVNRYEKRMAGQSVPPIYQTTILHKDNRALDIEVNAGLITYQGKPADLAIIRDISERKLVEHALRESEEKYRSILENIEDSYYEVDLAGNFSFFNYQLCSLLGCSAAEIKGMNYKKYCDEKTARYVFKTFNTVFRTRKPSKGFDMEITSRDGSKKYVETSIGLMVNSEGEPVGFRGIVREVTERKKVEQALRESEEKYRTILENIEDGYYEVDLEGSLTFFNDALCEILGYSKDEMMGLNNREYTDEKTAKKIYDIFNTVYRTGVPTKIFDYEIIRKDGTRRVNEASVTLKLDSKGQPSGFRGIVRDVTDRKQAEMALQRSEERYRRLIELSPDAITLTDLEFNVTSVNQQAVNLNGAKSADAIIGKNALDMIIPEDRDRAIKNAQQTLQDGKIVDVEYKLLRQDGTIYPAELSAALITDDMGEPFAFISILRDITERKRTEEALKESEQKFRVISERTMMGVAILQDEVIKYANQALAEIFEYSIEEILSWGPNESAKVIHPDDREFVTEQGRKKQLGEEEDVILNYAYRVLSKSGKLKWVDNYSRTISYLGKNANLVTLVDITERVRAEEALRESKEKYQMLVEKLEEGVTLEDAEGFITFANPKTLLSLGYSEDELLGKHWSFIVPEEELDKSYVETSKRARGVSSTYESSILTKNGKIIPCIVSASPIFSKTGEFEGTLVLSTDITDRKQVEEKLQQSEEKYSNLFHYSNDAIFLHDLDGNIIDVNQKTLDLFGYTKQEILSTKIAGIHPTEMLEASRKAFEKISQDGFIAFEIDFIKKNGETFPADVSSSLFEIGGKKVIQGIVRDITERKLAEETLRQVKLEEERYHRMLGHFLNNDMQKIINNLELLSMMYESQLVLDNKIVDRVIDIASGSSKTIDIVNKIFNLLQAPFVQPTQSMNLLNVIDDAVSEVPAFSKLFLNINKENLNVRLFTDENLKDLFLEVFRFILRSNEDLVTMETNIDINASMNSAYFSVTISDYYSNPLSPEIISKLSEAITDEWEIIGHNVGIALASIIMQYYNGKLQIKPTDPKGNEFCFLFPLKIIEA